MAGSQFDIANAAARMDLLPADDSGNKIVRRQKTQSRSKTASIGKQMLRRGTHPGAVQIA